MKVEYINTPFNYTGSKYKLLDQILPKLDYSKKTFIDIFTGGGSVYTNVLDKFENIYINDIIKDLVLLHKYLAFKPEKTIEVTQNLATCKDDKEKYLQLRDSYNEEPTPEKLWALILSCNSNLMRFNKQFKFNQTWGKRQWNPNTDKKTKSYVDHISKYKDKIKYGSKNFIDFPILKESMYYLDPPYINTEAGYNSYWSKELENKLYSYVIDIDKIGSSFMISGTIKHDGVESELLNKLSKEFKCIELDYNYNKISKKGIKETNEVIIINY
jgi:DNA adenine methylase Dam